MYASLEEDASGIYIGVRCRILGVTLFGGARRDADEDGVGRDISDDSLVFVLGGIGRIYFG